MKTWQWFDLNPRRSFKTNHCTLDSWCLDCQRSYCTIFITIIYKVKSIRHRQRGYKLSAQQLMPQSHALINIDGFMLQQANGGVAMGQVLSLPAVGQQWASTNQLRPCRLHKVQQLAGIHRTSKVRPRLKM